MKNEDIGEKARARSSEYKPKDKAKQDKPKFEFINFKDVINNLKPTEWLIQDILVDKTSYLDFGDYAHFKSFVALDRLLCIATGIDYHGHKVKQGPVFYIAGEGQQGLGRRMAVWRIHNKIDSLEIPFFLSKTPASLSDPKSTEQIRYTVDSMIKEYGYPLIIHFDTLARNFGDGDENSTKDMNKVIKNLDDAFRNDFGWGITQHTGHGDKSRARGSIVLPAAVDSGYRVSDESGQVLVECKKMKDNRKALPMLFNVNVVPLLINGQEDSSLALSLAAEGDDIKISKEKPNTDKLSLQQKRALNILNLMYSRYEKRTKKDGEKSRTPRVEITDFQDECITTECYKMKHHFRRAVEKLVERDLVRFCANMHFIYPLPIYLEYKDKDLL